MQSHLALTVKGEYRNVLLTLMIPLAVFAVSDLNQSTADERILSVNFCNSKVLIYLTALIGWQQLI